MNAFFVDNGSWLGALPDPDECHDGTLDKSTNSMSNLYRGQIWNLCKSCQNMYQYYSS